ncbi:MAG: hypothetical protein JWN97_987 [Nocardioides sp.]|nr:hypothetical protein [Nocardioides sp.]
MFRAALAGLLALGASCALAVAPAAAAPAEDPDPLLVHIDTISPVLPRSGDVEIAGTVTNTSDDTFTRINVHAFASQSPILESALLAVATTIAPTASVGERVIVPGTFDTIDVLAPGESADFSDSVPVELLGIPDQAGVYWIGVHALGDGAVPRDQVADGRARTFIPARPEGDARQEASVVLSLRGRVWYDDEGRIGGTDRWARRLEEGGTLDSVLNMADSAGGAAYSWLVDPAVLVALKRLSYGNPTRDITPDPSVPDQQPTPTPTDGETSEGETPSLAPPATEPGASTDEDAELTAAATAWLARFQALVGTEPVLTLPFGDLDVSAAVRHDPDRYTQALSRSTQVMALLGLPSRLAVAPDDGLLSPEALAATPPEALVMLGDNAFALPPDSPSSVVRLLGHKVVVTSTGAEAGGPGPTAASDPLALRQRLLSEAALHAVHDDTAPVIVKLPTVWRGEDAASFFTDLEQPWLDLVPVAEVADRSATGVPASSLVYTDTDVQAELGAAGFVAARRATDRATLLEQVLTLQTTIETQVGDEAMVTLSAQHRAAPRLAALAAGRIDDALRADLGKIQIEAPTRVTLSSDSGPLGATLVNGLDQPVTVRVDALTDSDLTVTGAGERTLGPEARSVVRLEAATTQPGLHNLRLAVMSTDGVPLGSTDELPVRAARVSALIWIMMGAGGLVLFGMIGYRLPGQIRARRRELAAREHGDDEGDEPEPTDAHQTGSDPRDTGPGDARLFPERP